MRKLNALLLLFFVFFGAQAQILNPVSWKTSVEKKSDTEVVLVFDAVIEHEWHMFSQFTPEGGSLPTVFQFKNAKGNYELVGKTKESAYKKVYSDVFEVDEYLFENKAQFRQTIKVTNPNAKSVTAYVEYQVCKESCIQQDKTFEIKLPALSVKASDVAATTATTATDTVVSQGEVTSDTVASSDTEVVKATVSDKPIGKKEEKKDSWTIFLGTLLAGILVTFTPCVFPMIPMTVSFFLKHSGTDNKTKGRFNALFYGFCIVAIYVLISVPFHLFESLSPDIFNEISTNVYLNLFFFAVFVIFSISFLGAFEITMPSSLANKVDNASNLGGLLGIFFMALTLIIVSFSCTGPALGLVLGSVLSTDGGATLLTIAMLGFGLGLALPFMIFALFPSLMGNLPKSGGWLNTVKVVFGLVELALAFKFLSNADLVLQLHLLERETFIAIWIVIFGTLAFYLFGKITLPHDSPMSHISVGRLLLGLLALSFTIYLIPGLWGAPLKLISGFPPPMTYSESPYGVGNSKGGGNQSTQILPDGAHLGAHDIIAFEDYEKGMAYAKSVNKPVLLDFTGFACVNCRKMEDYVWSKPEVLSILKEKVVLISLYVDDKRELPESEKYTSKETGKEIVTIGNKWSDFQITHYKANVQPFYIVLNTEGNRLSEAVGYTPDAVEYKKWLEDGVSKFKK